MKHEYVYDDGGRHQNYDDAQPRQSHADNDHAMIINKCRIFRGYAGLGFMIFSMHRSHVLSNFHRCFSQT